MSDNWQPGDLALCVMDGGTTFAGELFDVIEVIGTVWCAAECGVDEGEATALVFANRRHPTNPFGAFVDIPRFRKVTPPKADEFDREIIEIMTGKPVRQPA